MHEVDRDGAERRERRRDLLAVPLLVAFFAGIVLLDGALAFWTGAAAWTAVAVLLTGLLLVSVAAWASDRRRAAGSAAHRIQAALRAHADPEPGLRVRADTQARYLTRVPWAGWAVLLGPLGVLLGGDFATLPVAAAAGAVLVIGAAASYVAWWRVRLTDARRWLADPPGPPRGPAPLTRAERWMTGRRVAVAAVGLVVLALLGGGVVGAARGT